MISVKELSKMLDSKCFREFGESSAIPNLKIYFGGTDVLWISGGDVKVRGIDGGEYYRFWEASEFSNYRDADEMLNDDSKITKAKSIEVVYGDKKKDFNSWKEFIEWIGK